MSQRFGSIQTARYNGIPQAMPTGLCVPSTQAPKSVTLQLDWIVYWAQTGRPTELGVEIDLAGQTPEGFKLDKVRSIKIDNTFSTSPMYAYFPDTQDVISCPPQTVVTLPVNTNAQKVFIFAQNLTAGFLPYTIVWLFNILLPPTVDPAIQVTYPQWQGSPVIQQNFNQILTPGYNSPALGDQLQSAVADFGIASGTVPLFGSPYPNGYITITGVDLRIYKDTPGVGVDGTVSMNIASLGTAGTLYNWPAFYLRMIDTAPLLPWEIYSSPGNMNLKLDAAQLWNFNWTSSANLDAYAKLNISYTYSGIPSARNNLPIIPVMSAASTPAPFVASASTNSATAWQAFDALNTTYWLSVGAAPQWLQIDCGAGKTIYSYSIQADNASGWTPTGWTLGSSNDGVNWNIVDTQTGITWSNNQLRTFVLAGAVSGRYFRLNVAGPAGAVAFGKVQIYS